MNVFISEVQQWVTDFEACRSQHGNHQIWECVVSWWGALREEFKQAIILGSGISIAFSILFLILLFKLTRTLKSAIAEAAEPPKKPVDSLKQKAQVVENTENDVPTQETPEKEGEDEEKEEEEIAEQEVQEEIEGVPLIPSNHNSADELERDSQIHANAVESTLEESPPVLQMKPLGEQLDTTISSSDEDEDNTSKDAELESLEGPPPPTPSSSSGTTAAKAMFQEIETMRNEFRNRIRELEEQLENEKKHSQTLQLETLHDKATFENEMKSLRQLVSEQQQKRTAVEEEYLKKEQSFADQISACELEIATLREKLKTVTQEKDLNSETSRLQFEKQVEQGMELSKQVNTLSQSLATAETEISQLRKELEELREQKTKEQNQANDNELAGLMDVQAFDDLTSQTLQM